MIALRSVAAMSVSAMVPTATTEIAAGGEGVVRRFYRHYTTRATSLSLPLVVFAAASAPALLVAWLGDVPDDTVAIFAAITLAQATNLSTGVGTTISLGEGRAGLLAAAAVSATVVNVTLTVALTGWLGIWGVVGATIAGILVGDAIFLTVFHRRHAMSIRDFGAAIAPPLALSALAAAPALALTLVAPVEDGDRLGGIIASLICAATFVAIYWPLASRLDILPERLRLRGARRPVALQESETSSAA
jgi:O-antigen/teichoic acid export membrane protein